LPPYPHFDAIHLGVADDEGGSPVDHRVEVLAADLIGLVDQIERLSTKASASLVS